MTLQELEPATTVERALAYFDTLQPVTVEQMIGSWRGNGLVTGHPFDGQLEGLGWWGKQFVNPEEVHPLVMDGPHGPFSLNPSLVPLELDLRYPTLFRRTGVQRVMRRALPLLRTKRPAARLRMAEYRGVVSATMVYDTKPVNDHFRRVDARTVLGAMDQRNAVVPYLFVLRREDINGG
ncbi:DUF4334 domain-containing protein [Kineosporia succinea]|uniref:GXWXG protein n=1 Tax=Kineosporia succinea TaxID=84632 RepID=A0ABT9P9H0_9ACTN|nr:DUF4334 domain-containing protein [Kineosporia succinea]MDP9828810.1 hypothetical protein [Kineosporia succinea]